jgi:peptidoglycan/xylan/chitin deacetylase (PgdA/CDA1 family)
MLKSTLRSFARLAGAPFAPAQRRGFRILAYHSISDGDAAVDVSPVDFRDQIQWLVGHYQIVSLDQCLSTPFPKDDWLILTFDDGYADYIENAAPILERHNAPSTVYVISAHVENPALAFTFKAGAGKRSLGIRDLEQLMKLKLVTIGSHTRSHRRVTRIAVDVCETEIAGSFRTLSALLGTQRLHFCYPWGVANAQADRIVRQWYQSAVSGAGLNTAAADPFHLRRIPVMREPLRVFMQRIAQGGFVLEDRLRWLRDVIVNPRTR